MQDAHRVLNEVFGYDAFRLSQEKVWAYSKLHTLDSLLQVIARLLEDNKNALVVFPTGGEHPLTHTSLDTYTRTGGKSLTFQIPGMCLPVRRATTRPLVPNKSPGAHTCHLPSHRFDEGPSGRTCPPGCQRRESR